MNRIGVNSVFGRIHPRFRTPCVAVVLFTAANLALALSGTFAALAALNAIARLLYSISTCAAVPVLRRRVPPVQRMFTLPGGWLLPALGILASVLLLSGINPTQALIGGVGLLCGALIYIAWRATTYAVPAATVARRRGASGGGDLRADS